MSLLIGSSTEGLYLKMQRIHHKTRKVIYQSNKTCEKLLQLSQTVNIHQRYLRFLVTEVYKTTFYLNPKFMCSFFAYKEVPYNPRVKCFHCLLQDQHITEITQCTSGDPKFGKTYLVT